MNMQDYTTPFAINGDRDEFSIDTDPSGNVSLERGWTEPYQLRPEEGGKFIPRRIFNQMMNLVSTDTVTWKTQTFPNWIADKGDGTPYAYPKDMIVKYTDGNIYLSKVDNNIAIPTDTTSWSLYSFDINSLTSKTTPVNTDNLKIQESGGLFKKLSWANLKTTLGNTWVAYNESLSSFIPNTLLSGAIIERGDNANGWYTKFADGTAVYIIRKSYTTGTFLAQGYIFAFNTGLITPPIELLNKQLCVSLDANLESGIGFFWGGNSATGSTILQGRAYTTNAYTITGSDPLIVTFIGVGRWK